MALMDVLHFHLLNQGYTMAATITFKQPSSSNPVASPHLRWQRTCSHQLGETDLQCRLSTLSVNWLLVWSRALLDGTNFLWSLWPSLPLLPLHINRFMPPATLLRSLYSNLHVSNKFPEVLNQLADPSTRIWGFIAFLLFSSSAIRFGAAACVCLC